VEVGEEGGGGENPDVGRGGSPLSWSLSLWVCVGGMGDRTCIAGATSGHFFLSPAVERESLVAVHDAGMRDVYIVCCTVVPQGPADVVVGQKTPFERLCIYR
jgi:hypothetical protein